MSTSYAPPTQAPAERQPSYRDKELHALMKQLHASIRTNPVAKTALAKVESRLRYNLRVVELWDTSHAQRAQMLLDLGQLAAANTSASLIFDETLRHQLLRQATIAGDASAAERVAEARAMGREVL